MVTNRRRLGAARLRRLDVPECLQAAKILAFAYACEPGRGSEPGAGWAWARMLAQHDETWVITRRDYEASIEGALSSLPERENLRFVYVDLPDQVPRVAARSAWPPCLLPALAICGAQGGASLTEPSASTGVAPHLGDSLVRVTCGLRWGDLSSTVRWAAAWARSGACFPSSDGGAAHL